MQAVAGGGRGQWLCGAGWSSLELSDGCHIFKCNSAHWGLLPPYEKLLQTPVCWLEHGDLGNFIQSVISWLKNIRHHVAGSPHLEWRNEVRTAGLQAEQAGYGSEFFSAAPWAGLNSLTLPSS